MKTKRDTYLVNAEQSKSASRLGRTVRNASTFALGLSYFVPLYPKQDFEIDSSEEFLEKETSVAPSSVTHLVLQETFEKGKLDISQATLHGFPSAADAGHM